MISKEKSLVSIEFEIREALKKCSYWGELPISRSEYEYLCEALSAKKEGKKITEFIRFLFEGYPACVVTTMVFFVVFEYKDDFWGPWSSKIGIENSANYAALEGKLMMGTLKKFGKDDYEEDGFKYLTPIICQAGLPDSNLDDLFYALTTSTRFDAHELIAELKGWRAVYIKKPLERFVRLHEESAINTIVLVHDVMLDGEAGEEASYEGRIFSQYQDWKEPNLNKKGVFKGKGAYQENPNLAMDEDKGLCMILPEYIMQDEYCDSVKWRIDADDDIIFNMECEVYNDGNSKHSLRKNVPIAAREGYTVKLYNPEPLDGDKLLDTWEIAGLQGQDYMLFGENGKRRNDEMFLADGGTLIVSDQLEDIQFVDVFEDEIALPNDEGIRAYHFIPERSTASIRIGNNTDTRLALKKSIRANLCGGAFLFGSTESGYQYPIYTAEPAIRIEKEDGQVESSISMVLRNRDTGLKKTVSIDQVSMTAEDADSVTFDTLQPFEVGSDQYGRYSIKFYVKGQYKKEIEFAYIPEIIFDEKTQMLWPNEKGTFLTSGFRYKAPDEAKIDFISRVNEVTEKDDDGYWRVVKSREPNEFIDGTITIHPEDERALVIPFRKRIRNVQWMLWKENDVDTELSYGEGRLDIREIEEDNWLLSFSMKKLQPEEECALVLVSSEDEDIQKIRVKPSDKGKWHISLRAFQASMEDRRLPLTLVFRYSAGEERHEFKLVEIYESIILQGLKATKFKRKVDEDKTIPVQVLTWNPAPKGYDLQSLVIKSLTDLEMEDIPVENVRRKTTRDGRKIQFMSFESDLLPGLYKLAYGEEDYFDFGFDEFEPPVLTYENTFVVGQKELLEHFNNGSLAGILDAISVAYKDDSMLDRMVQIAEKKAFEGSLDTNDLRRVVVFANYGLKEPNGRCETYILSLLKMLYERLDESNKSGLFDTIIGVEIKESEKKKLIDFFGLYYVTTNETSRETIDKIMSIDTFLGTRSIMKCPRSQWVLHSLTASLGFDIMKEMMKKLPDGSVKVEATYEMFGDTNYFYNMFDWESVMKQKNYKPPKLDLSKRPEEELIFWSDGFINLLIKWYFKGQGKDKELENETIAIAKEINRIAGAVGGLAGEDVQDYLRKTIGREPQNNGGFYTLIAYSVKAGMIFALHDFGRVKLSEQNLDLLNRFIGNMNVIFPELIKRDILMAELYLYLKEV